jgi:diguanylate cyclase (GGDEF)-like protein/PAS domain S-box-containing protein
MRFGLPRTLHMRLVLAVAFIQLLAVGAFAAYWLASEVSNAVDARRVTAHRLLNLVAPAVQVALAQGDEAALAQYLERVALDPQVAGLSLRDVSGRLRFERRLRDASLHPLAAWFEAQPAFPLTRQLGPAASPLGVLSLMPANAPVNRRVEAAMEEVLVFFFIVLALDLIATQLIIRFFVAPLKPLTEMAMNVSQGLLDSTVLPEPTASEEVKQVGLALVTSARMLQKQIRDLELTRARLAENELRLRNLVNSMREVLLELDAHGNIRFLNPAWEKLTQHPLADCLNRPFSRFLRQPPQQAMFVFGRLESLPLEDLQLEVAARDGHTVWMRMHGSLQRDPEGRVTGLVATLEDVTEEMRLKALERQHEQELLQLSITDPLTGVYNRRHFDEVIRNLLQMNLARARPLALLIIDIDGFKFINDTYGHPVGDEVLRRVAEALRTHAGQGVVARLAGDEFAVILPGHGAEMAGEAARRLHEHLGRIVIDLPVGHLRIQTSIGVASAPAFGSTAQELVRAADVALYHAKKNGRNRVDVLSPDIGEAIMEIFSQGFELRRALEEGLIAPFLQPIRELSAGGVAAYEVLTRLKRGEEYVPADEFVLVAEDLGLIRDMDLFVIDRALRAVPRDIPLFLNISLNSFQSPEFFEEFRALLQSPLAAGRPLTIELTERQTTDMGGDFLRLVQELRARGVTIALDDFGAGYSTYGYLRALKPDFVKIDGSFVQKILTDPQDRRIVAHIHELAVSFGARTIAEHVEDEATREALARMGVHYGQGWLFGRPQRVEEYLGRVDVA